MLGVKLTPGKYVVAVSGGVDSMALLHMLLRRPDMELVVAHADHGIRSDAQVDERLVRSFCMSHNITYVSKKLHLGPNASEDTARKARYDFLQQCRIDSKSVAILTAHHQDDLVETVLINLLRGTGWRGLAPFSQAYVMRPLISATKKELVTYAKRHHVPWREDATNANQSYLRNYIRHSYIAQLDKKSNTWRQELLRLIRKQQALRRTIEPEVAKWLDKNTTATPRSTVFMRYDLIMLPPEVAIELLQATCRRQLQTSLIRSLASTLLLFAKVARPGKRLLLGKNWQARVTTRQLIVEPTPGVIS